MDETPDAAQAELTFYHRPRDARGDRTSDARGGGRPYEVRVPDLENGEPISPRLSSGWLEPALPDRMLKHEPGPARPMES